MRLHELRPLVVEIAAPQVLAFEKAPAAHGTLQGSPPRSAEVLEREDHELLVRYRTPAVVTDLVLIERLASSAHCQPRCSTNR